jgi:hypothetical protein
VFESHGISNGSAKIHNSGKNRKTKVKDSFIGSELGQKVVEFRLKIIQWEIVSNMEKKRWK